MTYANFIRLLGVISALAVAQSATAHDHHDTVRPPWQAASIWPDRIIATLAGDPATSFSVTWRTDMTIGDAIAEIAPALSDARFDLAAETVHADTERVRLDSFEGAGREWLALENQGLAPVHYHSVTFEGLEPDTLYAYRVRGAQGAWSAWRQLRTAPNDGPVQFLFFGDAQTGIRSHITRIFDTAAAIAPDARFAIHGGDLVNTAMYDREWAEWIESLGRTAVTLPSLPVTGNHDYANLSDEDAEDTKLFIAPRRVSPLWRPQFTLPLVEALPDDLAETVYAVRYTNDVHVFVLDSSGVAWDEQMRWLDAELEASDARWRIVSLHHPLFSFIGGNEHPSARERRLQLWRVLRRREPELVLTGHRHTYQRGRIGDDVARFQTGDAHDVETVFVVTASSTKRGETKTEGWDRFSEQQDGDIALTRHADNTPLFAVIDVDGDRLSFRAVDAVGDVYDAFTITRAEDGTKSLLDGAEALGELAAYDSTGVYVPWDDLR